MIPASGLDTATTTGTQNHFILSNNKRFTVEVSESKSVRY